MPVVIDDVVALNERFMRITLRGDDLASMAAPETAASIRLLVPEAAGADLVIPEWTGNEFLLPGGGRPVIRTFTPLDHNPARRTLELEIVRHPGGAVSGWAESATSGDPAALSGPGAAVGIDTSAPRWLMFGDESAIPAIGQMLAEAARLDPQPECTVHLEVGAPGVGDSLPSFASLTVARHVRSQSEAPGATLVAVGTTIESVDEATAIWAAGEAAAVQALRKHFFRTLGVPRSQATIRGYWKSRT